MLYDVVAYIPFQTSQRVLKKDLLKMHFVYPDFIEKSTINMVKSTNKMFLSCLYVELCACWNQLLLNHESRY